jgi:ribosomal protein S21
MSKTTVEVGKNANESGVNLIRRFQKRVQESGVLNKARSVRYNERPKSKLSRKNSTLTRIAKRAEIERLKKLGKIPDKPVRRGGRR